MKRLILRSVNVNKKTTTTCYRYNHFDTLGISKEASLNEIKLSFYKKAKELHPDVSSLDIEESTKKFIKLKTAYDVLANPNSRLQYMTELSRPKESNNNEQHFYKKHYQHDNHHYEYDNNINMDEDIRQSHKHGNFRRRRRKVYGDITKYQNNWDDFKQELEEAIDKAYYGPIFMRDDSNEYPECFEVEFRKSLHVTNNNDEICHICSGRQLLGIVYIPSTLLLSPTVAEMLSLPTSLFDENIDISTSCQVLHFQYQNKLHARATRKLNKDTLQYTMVFERINNNEHLDYLGKILKTDKFDIVYNHDNDETHRIVKHTMPGVTNYYWHSIKGFVELKMSKAIMPPDYLWLFQPRDPDFTSSWYFEVNKNGQYSRKFRKNIINNNTSDTSIENYNGKQHLDISIAILYSAFHAYDSLTKH
jgi:hypothetical protein